MERSKVNFCQVLTGYMLLGGIQQISKDLILKIFKCEQPYPHKRRFWASSRRGTGISGFHIQWNHITWCKKSPWSSVYGPTCWIYPELFIIIGHKEWKPAISAIIIVVCLNCRNYFPCKKSYTIPTAQECWTWMCWKNSNLMSDTNFKLERKTKVLPTYELQLFT